MPCRHNAVQEICSKIQFVKGQKGTSPAKSFDKRHTEKTIRIVVWAAPIAARSRSNVVPTLGSLQIEAVERCMTPSMAVRQQGVVHRSSAAISRGEKIWEGLEGAQIEGEEVPGTFYDGCAEQCSSSVAFRGSS